MFSFIRGSRIPSSVLLLAGLTLADCAQSTHRPPELENGTGAVGRIGGHDVETIAILGTNDHHGALAPQDLKTREVEGIAPIAYQSGGVSMLSSYVNVLEAEFGKSLLWLDAGDEFQGSIESNLDQGSPMVEFFNSAGTDAAAVGNHEFDYGPSKSPTANPSDRLGALKDRMSQARYPYLSANIVNKTTGQLATDLLPGLLPHKLFDLGKVKVGVIGLSTLETPRTTSSVNIQELSFAELKTATRREADALRKEGADIVVVTAHVGLKCERGRASASSHIRKPTEPQGDCGPGDELVRLLKSLPAGTIDAVVSGHSHQVVHHWVAGVPVIQGGAFGRYFNVIYLTYDVKDKKLLTDLTRIEGPVPVCPAVFQNQNDCNGDRTAPRNGRGALVPPKFHGETLRPDKSIDRLLKPTFEKSAEKKKQVIAKAARPIDHDRYKESEIGDLVSDAMRDVTGAQVGLMNAGGIRANWEQGNITYGDVFQTLPFDNTVVRVKVTGKELKTILRIAESGSRGYFPVSGVRLRILPLDADAPASDLNNDGRIEPWEVNRLVGATFADGSEILDNTTYTLATLDFLLTGGDDLGWAMAQIPPSRQDPPTMLLRDAVIQKLGALAKVGPINSVDRPIINPADPRMKFERSAEKGKKKGKKSKRRGTR